MQNKTDPPLPLVILSLQLFLNFLLRVKKYLFTYFRFHWLVLSSRPAFVRAGGDSGLNRPTFLLFSSLFSSSRCQGVVGGGPSLPPRESRSCTFSSVTLDFSERTTGAAHPQGSHGATVRDCMTLEREDINDESVRSWSRGSRKARK